MSIRARRIVVLARGRKGQTAHSVFSVGQKCAFVHPSDPPVRRYGGLVNAHSYYMGGCGLHGQSDQVLGAYGRLIVRVLEDLLRLEGSS